MEWNRKRTEPPRHRFAAVLGCFQMNWRRNANGTGPDEAKTRDDLYTEAAAQGIPEKTLERAKAELGATAQRLWNRATDRAEWSWFDPAVPWPKDAPFKKPFELPPLE